MVYGGIRYVKQACVYAPLFRLYSGRLTIGLALPYPVLLREGHTFLEQKENGNDPAHAMYCPSNQGIELGTQASRMNHKPAQVYKKKNTNKKEKAKEKMKAKDKEKAKEKKKDVDKAWSKLKRAKKDSSGAEDNRHHLQQPFSPSRCHGHHWGPHNASIEAIARGRGVQEGC